MLAPVEKTVMLDRLVDRDLWDPKVTVAKEGLTVIVDQSVLQARWVDEVNLVLKVKTDSPYVYLLPQSYEGR